MNAEDAFWLQLENEDGSREDVRRPGLIAISDPYNLRVNLSGFVAKASARTLRIVTRYGAETVAIGGVPIISSRTLPVEIFTEVSPSDAHPEAVAKVPTDFTLIGGGCESGFADNNPAHLMTWSYPAKSKDSKTGADEWRCGSRQHVVPAPGTVRAYAIALPKGTLSGEDVKILATQGSPSNRPTAVARLEPPYVLIGGGCLTSSTGSLLDFGPVIAASYPSDSRSWTCQGKTAHRQGQGQELPGPITAFAVGIKTLSLQRLEPSLTTQSADASEHPYATSSLVDKDLLEKQQRKVPENAALVGGGCWFSDEAAAGVYLVKAFPVEGLGSRRGWRCVFGSHALSGTAKANAVSIAMVPVLTLSAR